MLIMLRRVVVFGSVLLLVSAPVGAQSAEDESVRRALTDFLEAFAKGDLEAMKNSLASDATTFPRAIMSHNPPSDMRASEYQRVNGLDPQMIALIERRAKNRTASSNSTITPQDLEIKVFGDAALATFHLLGDNRVSRRTFILAKRSDEWKIVHLHASNVWGRPAQ